MASQLESSKSGRAHARSSPVWNFHGPPSRVEDSPNLTCTAEAAGAVLSCAVWRVGDSAYPRLCIAHRNSRTISPARRIRTLSATDPANMQQSTTTGCVELSRRVSPRLNPRGAMPQPVPRERRRQGKRREPDQSLSFTQQNAGVSQSSLRPGDGSGSPRSCRRRQAANNPREKTPVDISRIELGSGVTMTFATAVVSAKSDSISLVSFLQSFLVSQGVPNPTAMVKILFVSQLISSWFKPPASPSLSQSPLLAAVARSPPLKST